MSNIILLKDAQLRQQYQEILVTLVKIRLAKESRVQFLPTLSSCNNMMYMIHEIQWLHI